MEYLANNVLPMCIFLQKYELFQRFPRKGETEFQGGEFRRRRRAACRNGVSMQPPPPGRFPRDRSRTAGPEQGRQGGGNGNVSHNTLNYNYLTSRRLEVANSTECLLSI